MKQRTIIQTIANDCLSLYNFIAYWVFGITYVMPLSIKATRYIRGKLHATLEMIEDRQGITYVADFGDGLAAQIYTGVESGCFDKTAYELTFLKKRGKSAASYLPDGYTQTDLRERDVLRVLTERVRDGS